MNRIYALAVVGIAAVYGHAWWSMPDQAADTPAGLLAAVEAEGQLRQLEVKLVTAGLPATDVIARQAARAAELDNHAAAMATQIETARSTVRGW